MTTYWLKRAGLALLGVGLAVAGVVLWVLKRKADADHMQAGMNAAKLKLELERFDEKREAVTKALGTVSEQRAATSAALQESVVKLTKTLKETKGMTDEEINRELATRGYR